MSKTRKAEKIVAKKKINKYTAEDCQKAIAALQSKGQGAGVHFDNVMQRLIEVAKPI